MRGNCGVGPNLDMAMTCHGHVFWDEHPFATYSLVCTTRRGPRARDTAEFSRKEGLPSQS